jgi:hypothetical protein
MRIMKLFVVAVFTLSLAAPVFAGEHIRYSGPGRRGTVSGNQKHKDLKKTDFLPDYSIEATTGGAARKGVQNQSNSAWKKGKSYGKSKKMRKKSKKRSKKVSKKNKKKKKKKKKRKMKAKKGKKKTPFSNFKSNSKMPKRGARGF